MPDQQTPPPRTTHASATLLRVLSVLAALTGVAAAAVYLFDALRSPDANLTRSLPVALLCLFGAIAAGGLLWGLAVLVQRGAEPSPAQAAPPAQEEELPFTEPDLEDTHHLGPPQPDTGFIQKANERLEPVLRDMVGLLQEIRENVLLTEEQRAEKHAQLLVGRFEQAKRQIHDLLAEFQLQAALQKFADLARDHPGHPDLAGLQAAMDEARSRGEVYDVANYTKRVEELISISAWERASSVAGELAMRYPANAAAKALIDRVNAEREKFALEQQRRMLTDIQRLVQRRRWRESLAAVRAFLERFPSSADAETLRGQLATLQANADVEDRQEREAQITALAKSGRFQEAYKQAVELVQLYPNSPQAEQLRNQLPRLKDLAFNPKATPPRNRGESAREEPGPAPQVSR